MLIETPLLLRLALVAAIVFGYYLGAKKLLFTGAGHIALRVRRFGKYSRSEVQGVLELGFAVAGHLVLVGCLLVFSGVTATDLGLTGDPRLLVLGLLVGIGELALAMFVCQIIITATSAGSGAVRGSAPGSATANPTSSWMSASRAGWIRHHINSLRVLPLPVSMALSSAQVACEEIVFRSVFITLFQNTGAVLAILIPGSLFVLMQVFFMPSLRAAMFPVVGAIIMAVVHGVLFMNMPFIWPLVIAHAVFFYVAVL